MVEQFVANLPPFQPLVLWAVVGFVFAITFWPRTLLLSAVCICAALGLGSLFGAAWFLMEAGSGASAATTGTYGAALLLLSGGLLVVLPRVLRSTVGVLQHLLRLLEAKAPLLICPWWLGVLVAPWLYLVLDDYGRAGVPLQLNVPVMMGALVFLLIGVFGVYLLDPRFPPHERATAIQERLFMDWWPILRFDGTAKQRLLIAGSVLIGWLCFRQVCGTEWPPGWPQWVQSGLQVLTILAALTLPREVLRLILRLVVLMAAFSLAAQSWTLFGRAMGLPFWFAAPAMTALLGCGFFLLRELALWHTAFDAWLWKSRPDLILRVLAGGTIFWASGGAEAVVEWNATWILVLCATVFAACLLRGVAAVAQLRPGLVGSARPASAPFLTAIMRGLVSLQTRERELFDRCRHDLEQWKKARRQAQLDRQAAIERARLEEQDRAERARKEQLLRDLIHAGQVREVCTEPRTFKCGTCGTWGHEADWHTGCPVCGETEDPASASCRTCKKDTSWEACSRACHSLSIYQEEEILQTFQHEFEPPPPEAQR